MVSGIGVILVSEKQILKSKLNRNNGFTQEYNMKLNMSITVEYEPQYDYHHPLHLRHNTPYVIMVFCRRRYHTQSLAFRPSFRLH